MENGKVVEYGSVYEIFSNPQTPIAKHFVSTSLRNTPDELEEDQLLGQEGRLFTIKLTEKSGFFSAAANARNNGVYFSIVHGGVTTIQNQSFGNMTVRLLGEDSAIQQFYNEVAATTDIKEIVR